MKIILVGQAPGRGLREPLDGAAGRRLAALADLDLPEFLKRFDRVNLLDASSNDIVAMRKRADELREGWKGRRVVLLDKGVALAFRLVDTDYEWFKPLEIPPGVEVAVMPNPAGMSSWWNDPANERAARDYVLSLIVFEPPKLRAATGAERFTQEQVAAALAAGRGINSWAAKILAEQTGMSCSGQTIANYVERYPALREIAPAQKYRMLDYAEHNVVRSIEDGDMDTSRWILRSQMANGRGYALQVNGKVQVSGQIEHRHAHLHKVLDGLGLDLTRYSADQLRAIEDFAGVLGAEPDPE